VSALRPGVALSHPGLQDHQTPEVYYFRFGQLVFEVSDRGIRLAINARQIGQLAMGQKMLGNRNRMASLGG
jgi:hypothetical protein